MKRFLSVIAILLMTCVFSASVDARPTKKSRIEDNPKIEIVNETTIIFKDVVKIEVRVAKKNSDQITYVYDLKHSTIVKIARGSFEVELPIGNYLVQSNKRITRTDYEVIAE